MNPTESRMKHWLPEGLGNGGTCVRTLAGFGPFLFDEGWHCFVWSDRSCTHAKVRDLKAARVKSVHGIEHLRRWHQYENRVDVMQKEHPYFEFLDAWFPPRCLKSPKRRFAKFDGGLSTASLPWSSLLHLDGNAQVMTNSQAFFDCGEPMVEDRNDKILLHRTSFWTGIAMPLSSQFLIIERVETGCMGSGGYFASAVCTSPSITCGDQSMWGGEQALITARVALGDTYCTSETCRNYNQHILLLRL